MLLIFFDMILNALGLITALLITVEYSHISSAVLMQLI